MFVNIMNKGLNFYYSIIFKILTTKFFTATCDKVWPSDSYLYSPTAAVPSLKQVSLTVKIVSTKNTSLTGIGTA